jgi:hypothetical protein
MCDCHAFVHGVGDISGTVGGLVKNAPWVNGCLRMQKSPQMRAFRESEMVVVGD